MERSARQLGRSSSVEGWCSGEYQPCRTLQRYIQSLGFSGARGILNLPILVNVDGTKEDNSFYDPSPGRKDVTFGDGGVDDTEDAETIIHEYGHAIQDAIVPGYGQKTEGGAMGEGFGYYLAGTFYYRFKKGGRRVNLGEWDAKVTRVVPHQGVPAQAGQPRQVPG